MPKLNLNFSNVEDFVICEPGEQNFKITKTELAEYTNSLNITSQKLVISCEVIDGPSASATVRHQFFLTEKAMYRLFNFMQKLGLAVQKQVYELDTDQVFVGKAFTAIVEHEQYLGDDGKSRNVAKIVDTVIRPYSPNSTHAFNSQAQQFGPHPTQSAQQIGGTSNADIPAFLRPQGRLESNSQTINIKDDDVPF